MALTTVRVPQLSLFAMNSDSYQSTDIWLYRTIAGNMCRNGNENLICMPVDGAQYLESSNAIKFQVFLEWDTEGARDSWVAETPGVGDDVVVGWMQITPPFTFTAFPSIDYTITGRLAIGTTQAVGNVEVPKLDTVGIGMSEGSCFAVGVGSDTVAPFAYTDECFRFVVPDSGGVNCYVTRIKYYGDENQYGFNYCNGFENDILLPFYISRPQFQETRKIFSKSNGVEKLVSAVAKKTYELRTDYLTEHQHEVLKFALSHDNVYLIDLTILEEGIIRQRQVVLSDDYSIAWHETVDTFAAPARARVTLTPYEAVNSNCEACDVFCDIASDPSEIHFIDDGDVIFASGTGTVVDFSLEAIATAGCGELQYELDPGVGIYTDLSSVDDLGGGSFQVNVNPLTEGYYEPNVLLFAIKITCTDPDYAECSLSVPVYGTVAYDACPVPEFTLSDFVFLIQIQWDGAPIFAPEPSDGYRLNFYNATYPYPGIEYFYATGSANPYIHGEATNVYGPGELTIRLTAICNGEDGAFFEDTYEVPDFGYIIINACYDETEEDACGCGGATPVYIDSADVTLGVGVNVYLNTALTIPVPDGFISKGTSGESIFVISGGAGLITSDTGNNCL